MAFKLIGCSIVYLSLALCHLSSQEPGSPFGTILFYSNHSLFRALSSPPLPISWDGGLPLVSAEMQCLPSTTVVGRVSVKLNDRMAVGASQALAWLAVPHLGPIGLMRFILDESHQITNQLIQLQLLKLRLYSSLIGQQSNRTVV